MTTEPLFKAARPYQDDVLALPVEDLDQASQWYANALGLTEVERRNDPVPTVIMQRDGIRIGFAINGGDASNDGVAILVTDIDRARRELEASGLSPGESRIDDHGGQKMSVFFLVAPDGLCFYFHQPID
ncbi:MAG: VOC family protein [Chloroflexota bacterium]|nr:VOC family protein [Chloroflexota bacterium]MDE2901913.1 VOC family protein [Chloroflexota bacterium]MDE2919146.1 VOC family protein [Chloroflexota bacterium]